MTQWAKMVDSDGDGNFEIYQLHDEDPNGLWHPDALEFWRQVPDEHAAIGNVFEESSQTWYTGSAWGEKKTAEAPAPDTAPKPIASHWEQYWNQKLPMQGLTTKHHQLEINMTLVTVSVWLQL